MKNTLTIAKKEFADLFFSPIATIFVSVFLALTFWIFFSDFFLRQQASLRLFFNWVPILFMVFLPSITMGKWADEKKSGTLEILLTLPLKDWEAVLGKFLACLAFLILTLLLTLPLAMMVSALGDLDWGVVIGGYAGLIFMGAASLAVGLFLSSLTDKAIIAFILSFLTVFLFYMIGEAVVQNYVPDFLIPIFTGLSLSDHFQSITRGVLDSRDIFYYVSFTGFFLYLNRLTLENRKL